MAASTLTRAYIIIVTIGIKAPDKLDTWYIPRPIPITLIEDGDLSNDEDYNSNNINE